MARACLTLSSAAWHALQLTEEEKQQLDKHIVVDGIPRKVEQLMGRRKLKKGYEYEVKWQNMREKSNTWMTREE
jgi:elongation factor 3